MSDTEMTFSPEFAAALLEWDDRLFTMGQVRRHAKAIIQPLRDMNMTVCAKSAARIYQDVDIQLRTGELLIRMKEKFLAEHKLSAVEYEQWRQFTNTAMVWNELTEEETSTEFGEKTVAAHEAYITAAKLALVRGAQLDLVAERIAEEIIHELSEAPEIEQRSAS